MNPNSLINRWLEGMKNLTPAQQLHGKMVGHIGGAIGLVLAMVVLVFQGMWSFSIFLFFMIWLQVFEFIGVRQRWKMMCDMQPVIDAQKENFKKIMDGVK